MGKRGTGALAELGVEDIDGPLEVRLGRRHLPQRQTHFAAVGDGHADSRMRPSVRALQCGGGALDRSHGFRVPGQVVKAVRDIHER